MVLVEYKLYESLEQAKKFLLNINKNLEDNSVKTVLEEIKKLLIKKPNLIGNFVKYHYNENIPIIIGKSDKYYDSLTGLYNYIVLQHNNLKMFLPKDIIKYDYFEKLIDDIRNIEYKIKANNFIKDLYPNIRKYIDIDDETNVDYINRFIDLPKEIKDSMTPLANYKDLNGDKYIIDLINFINNLNNDMEYVIRNINEFNNNNKLQKVYDKNNIIIIRTFNKNVIKTLGSQRWCIVYAQEKYYNTYCNPLYNKTQYIIFDFNKDSSDSNSLYGISVNENNKSWNGASQNKINSFVGLDTIIKELNIDENIIVYYEYPKNDILNYFNKTEILESGKGQYYFSNEFINKLDLTLTEKLQYKLTNYISDSDFKSFNTKEKLALYNSYNEPIIRKNITNDELYALDVHYKIETVSIHDIFLFNYIKYEELDFFKKKSTIEKIKYYNRNFKIKRLRELITDEELYNLDIDYKLENYAYSFDLKNYITDDEKKNMTWNQKFKYNDNKFTDNQILELKKIPFSERIKFDDLYKHVIFDFDYNTLENIKIKLSENYITLKENTFYYDNESVIISKIFENYEDEYELINNFLVYKNDFEIEETDYIHSYFNDDMTNSFLKLMNFFGENKTKFDDNDVTNFLEKHADKLVYNTSYSTEELDISDITNLISFEIEQKFNDIKKQIQNILPYTIDGDYNNIELTLTQSYIKEINDRTQLNNMEDLLNNVDSIYDIIKKYNEKYNENIELLSHSEIANTLNYDFGGIIDKIDKILDNIDEDYEEKFEYIDNLLLKLHFSENKYEDDKFRINIIKINYKDEKIYIKRFNKKYYKKEEGWVNIKNLNNYLHQNLFDGFIYTKFDSFVNEGIFDLLSGYSMNEVKEKLKKLSVIDRFNKIKNLNLKYTDIYSQEEIDNFIGLDKYFYNHYNVEIFEYFDDYICIRTKNLKYYFIDNDGNILNTEKYDYIKKIPLYNLIKVEINDKYGIIDYNLNTLIPIKYSLIDDYNNGFAIIAINKKMGFIDEKCNIIGEIKYDFVYDFENSFAKVKIKNKYGFINENGEEICEIKYDYVDDFYNKCARVKLYGKWGLIDENGNEIYQCIYDFISSDNKKLFKNNKEYDIK